MCQEPAALGPLPMEHTGAHTTTGPASPVPAAQWLWFRSFAKLLSADLFGDRFVLGVGVAWRVRHVLLITIFIVRDCLRQVHMELGGRAAAFLPPSATRYTRHCGREQCCHTSHCYW